MRWVVLGGAFAIVWFLALLVALPMGSRSAHESGETGVTGTDPGAPVQPRLGLKLALATLAAAIVWAVFYGLVLLGTIQL